MSNDKLEEIKKCLESFSVNDIKEEKEPEELDLSTLFKDIDLSLSAGNITTAASNIKIYGSGGGGGSGYSFSSNSPYTITGGGGSTNLWNSNSTSNSGLQVNGDANFEGDIKVKGTSLTDRLSAIEKRLSILVPNPEKLEHFEALKKAYEHYKTLEALCSLPDKKEK